MSIRRGVPPMSIDGKSRRDTFIDSRMLNAAQ